MSRRSALMQTEYLFPELGDRNTPAVWEEDGSRDIFQRAHERVREILSTHYPQTLPREVDAKIRERFDIHLPPEDMRPECGRW